MLAVGLGANVESEGRDREKLGLALPGLQNQLVADAIAAAKAKDIPVIALLFVAGPVDPLLFADADAIIDCLYPAETAGLAIADTVFGVAAAGGRLPFSWPTTAADVLPESNYTMKGRTYRYDQKNVKWAFGHGKSYSTFSYADLKLSATTVDASRCSTVNITLTVKNTGDVPADEVVQGYISWSAPSMTAGATTTTTTTVTTGASEADEFVTPSLSLVDFSRVSLLQPGESRTVTLSMTARTMAVLSSPRCGVVPQSAGTQLLGTPFATVTLTMSDDVTTDGATECCTRCSKLEQCEAFTFVPAAAGGGGNCELFTHWGLTNSSGSVGAVSGEPLSEWSLRPGMAVEVSVGGSSDVADRQVVGTVKVEGPRETPLSSCPSPLPN